MNRLRFSSWLIIGMMVSNLFLYPADLGLAQVGKGRRGVLKEHHAEAREDAIEGRVLEAMSFGIGVLERDVDSIARFGA